MRENRGKQRRMAAAASVAAAVVGFAVLGRAGLAQTALAPAQESVTRDATQEQSQSAHKVEVCHKGKHTISISVNALPAHLRHGDTGTACTGLTGAAKPKPKKVETEQLAESTGVPATTKSKKPKVEKAAREASTGTVKKAKAAKLKVKTKGFTANGATKAKKASPPGWGGASPPGHANAKGHGKNK